MHALRLLMLTGLLLALAACGIEVPYDKTDYIGRWKHAEMSLWISAQGHVEYQRVEGRGTTSISAPLQAFDGDDFAVGIGWMTTRFAVSTPPHRAYGNWKMVVDGVELTRVED